MNIIGIIQARTASTRFKKKVVKKLHDKTLIEHILERINMSKYIDKIIVATTINFEDDILVELLNRLGIDVFRGNEENVLERFYMCSKEYNADVIVRITSDDPFKDPEIIDKAIKILIDGNFDYVSNTIQPTYPEGIDIEVFTFLALENAYLNAKLDSEKEHVTPFIWKNKKKFKIENFHHSIDYSHLRWTIDYEEDFIFAQKIYTELYSHKKIFLMNDIIKLMQEKKIKNEIIIERNEGYNISLSMEKVNGKNK